MGCARAQDIDIESFLVDSGAEEHRGFREHYPVCPVCSVEVAGWTAFEGVLAEVTGPAAHPADELLLAYQRAPETLTSPQRQELAQHLEACAPCRDALGAVTGLDLEQLLAEPSGPAPETASEGVGTWAWLADRLRGLFELPAPAWAAIAVVVLLLALGLPRLLGEEAVPPPPLAQHEEPGAPESVPTPPPLKPVPIEQLVEVPEAPAPAESPEESLPIEEQRLAEAPPTVPDEPSEVISPVPPAPEEIVQAPPPAPEEIVQAPPPTPAPPARTLITALGPEPVRFLPRVGLPAGRITGGTRAAGAGGARPLALVPQAVGLTLDPQPDLTWFQPEASASGVRVDVSDLDAMKTVLSKVVRGPLSAGVHVLRLSTHGVRLARDHNYQWMLTPVGADAPTSGGIVRRVAPDPALRAELANASPEQRLRILAGAGVWHDALDLLSRSIAARPADAQLRRARASLLEQQGLRDAAAWDRRAR